MAYKYGLSKAKEHRLFVREHCKEAGHPSLAHIRRGTVSKILKKSDIRPHKITYYLDRRDPEFDHKMTQVLHVYKEVELIKQRLYQALPLIVLRSQVNIHVLQEIMNTSAMVQLVYWPVLIFSQARFTEWWQTAIVAVNLLNI